MREEPGLFLLKETFCTCLLRLLSSVESGLGFVSADSGALPVSQKIDSLKKIWWQQQKSAALALLAQKATKRLLQCPGFQSTIYSALHHVAPGIHRKILVQ